MKDANVTSKKRLFTWVTPDLHGKVKSEAALKHIDMQDWVVEALEEKIEREREQRN